MLYVYGLVPAGQPEPRVEGVQLLPVGGLLAAASEVSGAPPPTEDNLRQHHRVLLVLLKQGSVLPFRFGSVFAGPEELQRQVEGQLEQFQAKLLELEGCAELSVELPPSPPQVETAPAGKGTAYLLHKKRAVDAEDRAAAHAASLQQQLGSLVRATAHGRDRVALLVPSGELDRARSRLRELEPRARVTGPWAPGSFV